MNKQEFLQELERRLQVLNAQERSDVLEEYAQHIDLKTANGQSEEEAVRDFGSMEELAGELLDAYHINARYASGTAADRQKKHDGKIRETAKSAGRAVGHAVGGTAAASRQAVRGVYRTVRSGGGKLLRMIARFLAFLWSGICGFGGRIARLLHLRGGRDAEHPGAAETGARAAGENGGADDRAVQRSLARRERREARRQRYQQWRESQRSKREKRRAEAESRREVREAQREERLARRRLEDLENPEHPRFLAGTWSALRRFGRGCMRLAARLTVLCLKAVLLLAALPVLALAAFFLYMGGFLGILLTQGYPVLGMTVCMAGGILTSLGLAALILSWVFGDRKLTAEKKGEVREDV